MMLLFGILDWKISLTFPIILSIIITEDRSRNA